MKALLDTSVYLEAFRSEAAPARFRRDFFPMIPSTFVSAVVAYELSVNAIDRRTRQRIGDFIAPVQRTGRMVTPAFDDWLHAAEIVTGIESKDRSWKSKLPALLNDILIALSARRIGAVLLTYNDADFRLIRRHVDFELHVLKTHSAT